MVCRWEFQWYVMGGWGLSVVLECGVRHLYCPSLSLAVALDRDFIHSLFLLSLSHFFQLMVQALSRWRGVACSGRVSGPQGAVLDGRDSGGCGWTVGGVVQSVVSMSAGVSVRGGVEMVDWL